jgi:hypothetical protein
MAEDTGVISEWHGVDYNSLPPDRDPYYKPDLEELIEEWDGCSPLVKTSETWPEVTNSPVSPFSVSFIVHLQPQSRRLSSNAVKIPPFIGLSLVPCLIRA